MIILFLNCAFLPTRQLFWDRGSIQVSLNVSGAKGVDFYIVLINSGEGVSVHINNEYNVARLLVNSLCYTSHLALSKDKIQIQENSRCCHLYCWSCARYFLRCSCSRSVTYV